MIELFGILSTICFFFSGWPAAHDAWKNGRTAIPVSTAWAVFLGAVLMFIYLTAVNGFDWIVTLDYCSTIVCWAVVLRFHYWPRRFRREFIGLHAENNLDAPKGCLTFVNNGKDHNETT